MRLGQGDKDRDTLQIWTKVEGFRTGAEPSLVLVGLHKSPPRRFGSFGETKEQLGETTWGPDSVDISKGAFTEDSPAGGPLGAGCQTERCRFQCCHQEGCSDKGSGQKAASLGGSVAGCTRSPHMEEYMYAFWIFAFLAPQ